MSKKLLVCVSLLVVLSLVIVGAASSCAPKETKILKCAYPLPEFDIMVVSAQEAADEFNEAAKGEYKIEIYAGGVLAGMLEQFDLIREGSIEMGDFSPDFISGKDLLFAPQGLPFALKDVPATNKFYDLIREAKWQDVLRDKYNVEMLHLACTAPHDWAGTKPIHTMEDWKGTVIWVSGPVEAEALTLLGASPVTMDWNEGPTAIEKGVVDGCIYGVFAAWMSKWEWVTNFTLANGFESSSAIVVNLDVWNAMPKNLQDVMITVFKAHEVRIRDYFYKEAVPTAIAEQEAVGNEVYYLPEAERARWKDATASVIDNYYAKLDPADAQLIQDLLAQANQ